MMRTITSMFDACVPPSWRERAPIVFAARNILIIGVGSPIITTVLSTAPGVQRRSEGDRGREWSERLRESEPRKQKRVAASRL